MDHLEKQHRKIHPKDKNNFFSNIFFIYALTFYKKGFKRSIEEKDLYEVLHNYRAKQLGDQIEREWEKQKKSGKRQSIIRLLWSCYGYTYLRLGLMAFFINILIVVIRPYALGKLVGYFKPGQLELTKQDAYMYAALVIGLNFFQCIYKHNYYLLVIGLGIRVRTAFCSFIYRKALKLSPAHLGDISIGKIVTLMTKDVDAFESFADFGNDTWIAVITTIVVSFILYNRIGIAALAGIGFFLMVMPLQMYLGTRVSSVKTKNLKKTDERLRLTQETLSAITIIKMYTWEKIFDDKITKSRQTEVNAYIKMSLLRFTILIIGTLNSHISFYIMITTYIWFGNQLTAETLYFIWSTFHTLSYILGILFPIAIYQTAALIPAIKRIGNIVKALEIEAESYKNDEITILPKIDMKNVTVALKNEEIIKEINLNLEKGLTVITGPVGSGKSFLLKTILQDYKPKEGTLSVKGNISYASQEPWLFPSSIKQNILFGEEYNEKRYQEVLKVCALIFDFEILPKGDKTIVEDRGINLSKGQQARINLARAIYKDSGIYLLDDSLAALDAHVSAFIFKECILNFLKDKLVVLVTHNPKYGKNADNVVVLQNGMIKSTDKFLTFNEAELNENYSKKVDEDDRAEEDGDEETTLITETITERKVYHEEKKGGKVAWSVYKRYIKSGGGYFAFIMVYCLFILCQLSISATDKLVSKWVGTEEKIVNYTVTNNTNTTELEGLLEERSSKLFWYSLMTAATALTTFGRAASLLLFARRASLKIHKRMISKIINASMEFFDKHFIGNILNRFSKDLTTVDEHMPSVFYHVFRVFLYLAGIIILIASVNPWFLIPTAIFFLILIALRMGCLRTSRNLKRLDASTRSPVVGHMNATLEGLTTIRAFQAESILRDEFDRHQDLYTSATFTLVSCMRCFAFTLDSLCGVFITIIVMNFIINDSDTPAGDVGLAITQAFSMTGLLQWGIRQWAEVENGMTSVERVLEYTEAKQENKQGLVLEDWPQKGQVKYENVKLMYTNSTEYVLKNINFTVKPREKIGIVGRTGAGKSSIISTLFRLYEVEGKITIDDVDIKTLSLEFLRANISIIPQDPVLFSGTIRDNIDPMRKYTDEQIWKAIETANLTKSVPALDFEIVENGTNFSVGQRQLICLARALIRNNKIIVLDEATANMDVKTDELIHETIKKNFAHCTVFTIAHKLHSILNSDKVMVMDKGEIIEFDEPSILLQNTNGTFYKLVEKAGLLLNQQ